MRAGWEVLLDRYRSFSSGLLKASNPTPSMETVARHLFRKSDAKNTTSTSIHGPTAFGQFFALSQLAIPDLPQAGCKIGSFIRWFSRKPVHNLQLAA